MIAIALAAAAIPTVGCAQRAEPSPPLPTAERWVISGPVAWAVQHQGVGRRGKMVFKKAGIAVDAGGAVTLRVLTARAGLVYRHRIAGLERWQDADRVLRVKPCAPDQPEFSSDGTVGPRTGFAGMLVAGRKKCVRVRVSRGGESWTARLPVGRPCA
jgi:hypothetical protein